MSKVQKLRRQYQTMNGMCTRETLEAIIEQLFNIAEDYEKQLQDGMEKSKQSAYQILCGGDTSNLYEFPTHNGDNVSISTCINELDCRV